MYYKKRMILSFTYPWFMSVEIPTLSFLSWYYRQVATSNLSAVFPEKV